MDPIDIAIPGQRGPRLVLDRLMQRPAGHLANGEVRIGDHLTPPAPVTWDRKELRKEKGEKVFCAGAGARRAASSRRELRGRILPLAVRGGLQHYPGLHTASLLQYTLVITSHTMKTRCQHLLCHAGLVCHNTLQQLKYHYWHHTKYAYLQLLYVYLNISMTKEAKS